MYRTSFNVTRLLRVRCCKGMLLLAFHASDPNRAVVKRRAAVRRAGVGADQRVDAEAAFECGVGPDRLHDDDAPLQAVESFGMQRDRAARIADFDTLAG